MAVIDPIYNGESGPSVRDKINELIDTVNSGSTTINVGDAPLYDPNKAGGYEAGSIISYKNETSPDPEFHEFAIYLALSDIAQGIGPEDSPEWSNQGTSVEVAGGNTANGVVQNITRLRELTGMRTGHTVAVQAEGSIYIFDEGSEIGVKPFAPGIGSWRRRGFLSFANIARVFTQHDAAEGDEVSCPLLHAIINFAHSGKVTIADDNGDAALNIVFDGPCVVRRIAAPFVLSSFEITPLSTGGGHTFEDSEGNVLPARSVAKAGDGIEFEDDVVGEKTVVRVDDTVSMKAENFNQGNLKKFDANGNDEDSGLTGESLDIYDIGATVVNELTTEGNWIDGNGAPITTPILLSGGIKGQRYYSNDFFYECVSDFNWRRTFTGRPVIDIYNNPNLTLTDKSNLENAANWSAKAYIGPAIDGVAAGTLYYDNDYVYEFVQTNLPIRYARI